MTPSPAGFGQGHVVVDGDDLVVARVRHALPADRPVTVVVDAGSASTALLKALDGTPLLVHAQAPRAVVDVLCDDLRRLARVDLVRTGDEVPEPRATTEVDPHGEAILRLLAEGRTLGQAASALGLSRRTADRRLAAARDTLGARSTAEAVALWSTGRGPAT